jgi:hypothetical protein
LVNIKTKNLRLRVWRKVLGTKKTGVTGGRTHLHDAEILDKISYPNIIQVVSLRRLIYVGNLEIMGYKKVYTGLW